MDIKKIFKPYIVIYHLNSTVFKYLISDKTYVKAAYRLWHNKKLNLNNPTDFTEKLQWLKLYYRNPLCTLLVDKYRVKEWVANKIGKEYVVPLYGMWKSANDIDFSILPKQFVIKTNHDSKGLVICRNKDELNEEETKKKMKHCLEQNYYYCGREWPYKNVERCIIAEKYLEDTQKSTLYDYKFFCFDGEPKLMYVVQGRNEDGETTADFFDMDYNHLELKMDHEMSSILPNKPLNFELMKIFAKKLSKGLPEVRVDFYETDGHLYFGEMTFFHSGGLAKITPDIWNKKMGSWIKLPTK